VGREIGNGIRPGGSRIRSLVGTGGRAGSSKSDRAGQVPGRCRVTHRGVCPRAHRRATRRDHRPGMGPPVTQGVRLTSVVNETARYAGQVPYLRGLVERRREARYEGCRGVWQYALTVTVWNVTFGGALFLSFRSRRARNLPAFTPLLSYFAYRPVRHCEEHAPKSLNVG